MTRPGLWLGLALGAATADEATFVPRWDGIQPTADELVVKGVLRSSLDGSAFDAITQRGGYPGSSGAEPRLGGLYDLEAGGLRVAMQDPAAHVYRLVGTGQIGPACRAAGVASPCLVPRMRALAHERLVTADDLGASLSGNIELELLPPPVLSRTEGRTLVGVAVGLLALVAWAAGWALRQRRRRSAIGQVHAAAAQARRATRGDATLAPLRTAVDALVARAEELEEVRRSSSRRLSGIDRAALDERRLLWTSRASDPDAAHAVTMLAAETAEANQLEADLSASLAGIDRIASSLRALALRTRQHRGTRARAAENDPVDAMLGELELRQAALGEAERVVLPTRPAGGSG
jgi:hypothetical protein